MRAALAALLIFAVPVSPALADDQPPPTSMLDQGAALFDSGKLLATGGVSDLEGAGGGGLTTWALISGYGTRDAVGANGHFTDIDLGSYLLQTEGVTVGLFDRVELSYAYQSFDTEDVGAKLGLGKGFASRTYSEHTGRAIRVGLRADPHFGGKPACLTSSTNRERSAVPRQESTPGVARGWKTSDVGPS